MSKKVLLFGLVFVVVLSVLLTACGSISAGGQIDLIGSDGGVGNSAGGLDSNAIILLVILVVLVVAAVGRG
ncbi:MAG: hypothetical protein KF828_07850 [Anaerolineales bacterium]|nr:hypothetical protein [Anaerolineales bacterium]